VADTQYHGEVTTTQRRLAIATALTAFLAIAAVVLSSVAIAQRPVVTPPSDRSLSGVYADGAADRPHYVVVLTDADQGRIRGAMDYEYQDGQTTVVFTFRGTSQARHAGAASGVLTLEPVVTIAHSSAQLSRPPPPAFAVTYGHGTLQFGECAAYLRVTTLAGCAFSSNGAAE